jgi:membrane-associated phospholipid phosphatase
VSAPAVTRRFPAEGHWLRTTWPVDRGQVVRLVVALVATIGGFTAVGLLLTDVLAPNAITRADDAVADWFLAQRTPLLDDLAWWGSFLSDTLTKIVVTAVVAVAALAAWHRWHEALFVAVTLIFQATAFIIVTLIVARPRPDVPQLQESPVDSSFPSGHVAAAVVYGAFVIVASWHVRSAAARAAAAVAVASIAAAVALARLYQGMHHLSDVIAGVVLGLVSLAICFHVLGSPEAPTAEIDERAEPGGGLEPRQDAHSIAGP